MEKLLTADWIKDVVKLALLPPAGPLLVALVGYFVAFRKPRAGRALILIGIASLTLLCIPAVGALLVRTLDRSPPLDLANARDAGAIVILGGGSRRFAPEYAGPTVNALTLERVRYGARVARLTGLPILVSGGAVRGNPAESLLMRDILMNEYGLSVKWTELGSRDTHENATQSAAMLIKSGVHRVIVVGHAFDFPRVRMEFEASGISVIAAPINIPPRVPSALRDYTPSVAGLRDSYYALYEALANIAFLISRESKAVPPAPQPTEITGSPLHSKFLR
jgi:uncharacterized SAM-binding protein YcdF (DUF218 family)